MDELQKVTFGSQCRMQTRVQVKAFNESREKCRIKWRENRQQYSHSNLIQTQSNNPKLTGRHNTGQAIIQVNRQSNNPELIGRHNTGQAVIQVNRQFNNLKPDRYSSTEQAEIRNGQQTGSKTGEAEQEVWQNGSQTQGKLDRPSGKERVLVACSNRAGVYIKVISPEVLCLKWLPTQMRVSW